MAIISTSRTWIIALFIAVLVYTPCLAGILMSVSPYPARIYENAPPGVPVVTVVASDNATGLPVTSFQFQTRSETSYFKIDSKGVISTQKIINFSSGRTFEFFVFAVNNNETSPMGNLSCFDTDETAEYKHVKIIVSAKNKYAPYFMNETYTYPVYRNGIGDVIGLVAAQDDDEETYNRQFNVYAQPGQEALQYVDIDSDRVLRLIQPVPESIPRLTMKVLAVDGGSPQMTGTTEVKIDLLMVKQPDIFCFAATKTMTTLCWKNPMPQQDFDGYSVSVRGSLSRNDYLPAIDDHTEACYNLNGTQIGGQYIFRVTVKTTAFWYGDEFDLVFNKTSTGHTRECESHEFSYCSYRNPCNGHGECTPSSSNPKDFTCHCLDGWKGDNCSEQDMCNYDPCENGGTCTFEGDKKYSCDCPHSYFGLHCEHYNICLDQPCENFGDCDIHANGSYSCDCPATFSGKNCEYQDPCSESPCLEERGECIRRSDTEFECMCFTGYYGDRCQNVDACLLQTRPCNYQGTCIPQGETFRCICPPGANGTLCEIPDPCFIKPCQNNGVCTVGSTGAYVCQCLPGYHGNECQTKDLCHDVNCNNGTCKLDGDDPRCECERGFYGEFCESYDVCKTQPCNNHGTCTSFNPIDNTNTNYKADFTCECFEGWDGKDCNNINSCSLNVCKNGGSCENVPPNQYRCSCPEGYYLSDCSAFDPCSTQECLNGAECRNLTQTEFECTCADGWLGERCQLEHPCSDNRNPCKNDGECVIEAVTSTTMTSSPSTITSYTARCECEPGYLGRHCEFTNPCTTSRCEHGECILLDISSLSQTSADNGDSNPGYPQSEDDLFMCSCDTYYTGQFCDTSLPSCDDITCLNGGDCEDGECLCPPGFIGTTCEYEIQPCKEKRTETEICLCTDGNQLQCSPIPVNDTDTLGKLNNLQDGTSDPQSLTADEVVHYANQLVDLYNETLNKIEYAQIAVGVIGNLGKVKEAVSLEVEKGNKTNTRLRGFLDSYTSEVDLNDMGGQLNISTSDIAVKAVSIDHILDNSNNNNNRTVFQPSFNDSDSKMVNLSISLPNDVLLQNRNTRIQFIGHSRSQLFVPAEGFDGYQDKQHVISATVKGRELRNLTQPVVIRLPQIRTDVNHSCVFWDPNISDWSTEGVTMFGDDDGYITCQSTHLTSFAVLMDTTPGYSLGGAHEEALMYITYIGCAISLICLVITIVTYGLFRCLHGEKSGKILLHLCVALVLLNVTFLIASVDVSGYSDAGCIAVGLLLHYVLLAALMWMLVEAIEMYQALVTVFTKYERMYLLKRCLIAWGIPAVIVGITAAVDVDSYLNKENRLVCFLTSQNPAAYYASLVAPSCGIIIINTIVFIFVARVILKPKFQQQIMHDNTAITPAQVRGAFTVMFLLGVTWVFGPLAINEAKVIFSYLFCICNSLQGFLIFVFRCLCNPEAKLAWLQLFQTGTLKRRRGPIKSIYSDSSSKGADNRRMSNSNTSGYIGSGTSRTTLSKNGSGFHPHPHQLHNTNGWNSSSSSIKKSPIDSQAPSGMYNYRPTSSQDKRPSAEVSVTTKRESLPRDYQDESTHF